MSSNYCLKLCPITSSLDLCPIPAAGAKSRNITQAQVILRLMASRPDVFVSCPCGAPSLSRGRAYSLLVQFAFTLRSKSLWTHDHSLFSHLRLLGSLNPEDQVPVFISPRNRVTQLYPRALGSHLVASYDSQSYGGSILTRLHTGTY
jgi:hypothetical protein